MQARLVLVTLFCLVFSAAALADYDEKDLKKLFTDKNQRAQIDAARSGKTQGAVKKTSKVKVSGYMTRSDGKSVVWINNKSTLESSRIGDVRVNSSSVGKDKKVTVRVDGKTRRLRPGETWYKQTGEVIDGHKQ